MDYETNKQGYFNAGFAQVERIDALQRAINAARFNPIATNPEVGTFNYEVMINANDGLLAEAWSKLNTREQLLGERIRKVIHDFIIMNQIIIFNNGQMRILNENLTKLMELLNYYEKTNKIFLDNHKLNNPDREDDDGL